MRDDVPPDPNVGSITVGEALARVAPGKTWQSLVRWPPDVFAVTSVILADSGAYRLVICPPEGMSWPPSDSTSGGSSWGAFARSHGEEWAASVAPAVGSAEGMGPELPETVSRLSAVLDGAAQVPLSALDDADRWGVTAAILVLHALADEACVGAGLQMETGFQRVAFSLLEQTSSLSRLHPDRVRVLPKLRPPDSGITLRSISHHLAIDRTEVRARWQWATGSPAGPDDTERSRLTLLLVPHPPTIHASDFRPVARELLTEERSGFYEYDPAEPLQPSMVLELVEAARRRVSAIDAVVLPESALDENAAPLLQRMLGEAGVPYLIAGVRRPAGEDASFGANYAYIGGEGWHAVQHKHHRWCLDPAQVNQYHLGAALDPDRRWWEAISIRRRSLNFVTIPDSGGLTICPLVCEDLARPDPVTDVIRAVAPSLVVALLLDGPQIASRWPARYASVLADDPGCSVLTLTALGMAWRSQPAGVDPSRVIALWKDPHGGLQQITLPEGARAVALTAHRRQVEVVSADGRVSAQPVPELVLSGLEQIS
jgi:hypothetical protein